MAVVHRPDVPKKTAEVGARSPVNTCCTSRGTAKMRDLYLALGAAVRRRRLEALRPQEARPPVCGSAVPADAVPGSAFDRVSASILARPARSVAEGCESPGGGRPGSPLGSPTTTTGPRDIPGPMRTLR